MLRVDQIFLENIPDVKKFRQNKPGGDWVIDARIFRKMGDYFSLGLIGKNILNEEYLFIPGNLGAPRSINFQLNYQIK
jgi:outer membrane receptor for ferric coprogen and ferric-rhodotorulic acid